MVTDSDAVSKEIVVSCDQVVRCDLGMETLSFNEKCEGGGEEDNSFNSVTIKAE